MQTEISSAAESFTRRWTSIKGAAAYTGTTARTISQLIEDGYLPGYRFGPKTVRVDLNEVDQVAMRPYEKDGPVTQPDEQELAALTVLRAVEYRMQGDSDAALKALHGTSRQVSLRLIEAVDIINHLLRHSDRPEQALAALLQSVTAATDTTE